MEPASSGILVGFVIAEPQRELLSPTLNQAVPSGPDKCPKATAHNTPHQDPQGLLLPSVVGLPPPSPPGRHHVHPMPRPWLPLSCPSGRDPSHLLKTSSVCNGGVAAGIRARLEHPQNTPPALSWFLKLHNCRQTSLLGPGDAAAQPFKGLPSV